MYGLIIAFVVFISVANLAFGFALALYFGHGPKRVGEMDHNIRFRVVRIPIPRIPNPEPLVRIARRLIARIPARTATK